MAVHIRLRRMGTKKRPFYRIVAADSRRARDGRFLEILGTYNPVTVPAQVNLKEEKITNWLNQGATPSDTVASLFTQVGFTEKYHSAKKGADISAVEIRTVITERKKKTRKMKKAAALAIETAKAEKEAKESEAAEKAKAAEEAAEVKDAPVEDAPKEDKAKAAKEAATTKDALAEDAPEEDAASAAEDKTE